MTTQPDRQDGDELREELVERAKRERDPFLIALLSRAAKALATPPTSSNGAEGAGDPLAGLDERLDRLCLTAKDNQRFILSTESAKNIVEIVRAWISSRTAPPLPAPPVMRERFKYDQPAPDAMRLAVERLRQFASVFDSDAYADEGEPNMREDIELVCSAAESYTPAPSPTAMQSTLLGVRPYVGVSWVEEDRNKMLKRIDDLLVSYKGGDS